ncbi:MAG TPA: hypothetical protein VI216_10260, partial [Candidatus Acidoferrales bacterium]
MNVRIPLAMIVLVGIAAAKSVCGSGTVPLSALANSTCRVGAIVLKFGSLADLSYRPNFHPIDPNSYHIQISVGGNSITFTSPGFSASSLRGTDSTSGYLLPLTISATDPSKVMGSDFKVVFTADLMGGKASVQKCGYAVVNGAMVQFGEMWTYGCTVDSHFDYTHSKLLNPGWALSRPLSLSIGTNGGTASFSSSSVTYQFVSFPKAAS